jgi:DNA-binding NarL/FixJ family response regulator
LYVTSFHRTGGWLAEAFASDSAVEVQLDEANGMNAGLAHLREEVYDAVLLSHTPGELDALEFLSALRGGGSEEPVVVLGAESEQEMAALAFEAGADSYVCVNTVTTRTLIWMVARAVQRRQLTHENRRLTQAEHQRRQRELAETRRILDEQQAALRTLHTFDANTTDADPSPPDLQSLPQALVAHYRELLRAYVIMGSGNLTTEVQSLAELLTVAGLSAKEIMSMHLSVLELLVLGLGNRSSRHVTTRADLLILELLVYVSDGYRQRYRYRVAPPVQQPLPGIFTPAEFAAHETD